MSSTNPCLETMQATHPARPPYRTLHIDRCPHRTLHMRSFSPCEDVSTAAPGMWQGGKMQRLTRDPGCSVHVGFANGTIRAATKPHEQMHPGMHQCAMVRLLPFVDALHMEEVLTRKLPHLASSKLRVIRLNWPSVLPTFLLAKCLSQTFL